MNELNFKIEEAVNEPIKGYEAGSLDKKSLKSKLNEMSSTEYDIPLIINGQEIKTGNLGKCVMPHDHKHILGHYHKASNKEVAMAIENLLDTWN